MIVPFAYTSRRRWGTEFSSPSWEKNVSELSSACVIAGTPGPRQTCERSSCAIWSIATRPRWLESTRSSTRAEARIEASARFIRAMKTMIPSVIETSISISVKPRSELTDTLP